MSLLPPFHSFPFVPLAPSLSPLPSHAPHLVAPLLPQHCPPLCPGALVRICSVDLLHVCAGHCHRARLVGAPTGVGLQPARRSRLQLFTESRRVHLVRGASAVFVWRRHDGEWLLRRLWLLMCAVIASAALHLSFSSQRSVAAQRLLAAPPRSTSSQRPLARSVARARALLSPQRVAPSVHRRV